MQPAVNLCSVRKYEYETSGEVGLANLITGE